MKTENEFAQVNLKEYLQLKNDFEAMEKAIKDDLIVMNYNTNHGFGGVATDTKYKRRDEVIDELMAEIKKLDMENTEILCIKNITINENESLKSKINRRKWYQFIKI